MWRNFLASKLSCWIFYSSFNTSLSFPFLEKKGGGRGAETSGANALDRLRVGGSPQFPNTLVYIATFNSYFKQSVSGKARKYPDSTKKSEKCPVYLGTGLHELCYPTIRDRSTGSKFGAHGEHGDVFLFSNLGAL